MPTSVRFYRDLLGLEIIYGGEEASFSSPRTTHGKDPILNLGWGNPVTQWGRLIFYVSDVDRFWAYLKEQGLLPQRPQDPSCGERYFHLSDPDGHELSVARYQSLWHFLPVQVFSGQMDPAILQSCSVTMGVGLLRATERISREVTTGPGKQAARAIVGVLG